MTEEEELRTFLENPRIEVENSFNIFVDDDGSTLIVLSVWGQDIPQKGFLQVFENANEAVLWRIPDCGIRLVNIPASAAEAIRKSKNVTIAEMEGETAQNAYKFDVVVADPST